MRVIKIVPELQPPPRPAPAPPAPPEPETPHPKVRPLRSRIAEFERWSGTYAPLAGQRAQDEAEANLVTLRIVSPAVAARIDSALGQIHALELEAATTNSETIAVVNQVEGDLRTRAALLVELPVIIGQLDAAKAELNDPTKALGLTDERVIVLTNQTRHLPARIAELTEKVKALEVVIKDGIAKNQIDGLALVAHLYAKAVAEKDARTRQLHDLGFYKLPE